MPSNKILEEKKLAVESLAAKIQSAKAGVLVKYEGLVLSKYTNRVDVGVYTVGKGEVDNSVLTSKGDCRFCCRKGQSVKSATLSTCEKHCDAFFFLKHIFLLFHLLFMDYCL